MNLPTVIVIARKELKDVLRDRRTLVFMMLLPIVVMPVLFILLSKFVMSQEAEKQSRVLTLAVDAQGEGTLKALGLQWFRQNWVSLGIIQGQQGMSTVGGIDGLKALLAEQQGPDGSQASEEQQALEKLALATRMLKANMDMPPEQTLLMRDMAAVISFLGLTDFVRLSELAEGGHLAEGVEIPEGLPEELGQERVALAVQEKRIQAAVSIAPDALIQMEEASGSVSLHVLFDSSQSLSKEVSQRLDAFLEAINRQALKERLSAATLPGDFAEPFRLERANVATASRKVQAVLGGILPYLIFGFCFFGALYPALDLTAGEKERFTLETLLLAPVSRGDIALGKFLVVFVAAVVAAVLTTTSMVLSLTHGVLPANLASTLQIEFQPLALLLTASLVLPVAALYSALLLAVGLYARSFKEAQSYTVPLQFLLVLPMMVSLLPDVEAESHLAWIPFVNISMLMKELLKGNYLWGFYGITLASTLVLTALSLWVAARLFQRESVMLRT
jgi:sodium transport system permease protein